MKPLTRGLLHPDPHSVCPLSSAEFVEPPLPRKKSWVRYWYGGINRSFSGHLRLSVIFYYPANGNRSLARIIQVLLYYCQTVLKAAYQYRVSIPLMFFSFMYFRIVIITVGRMQYFVLEGSLLTIPRCRNT
jgi:uncharacterized membrane protein